MLKQHWKHTLFYFGALLLLWGVMSYIYSNKKTVGIDSEVKNGIQNHLVWSIKGECFFIRPTEDDRVYLIAVPDCDKK
jgi:hypothetical protein